jgi:hypothetical protein
MVIQNVPAHFHFRERGQKSKAERMKTSYRGCQSPLVADYHLPNIAQDVTRAQVVTCPRGLWRGSGLLFAHRCVRILTLAFSSEKDLPASQWVQPESKFCFSMLVPIEEYITG